MQGRRWPELCQGKFVGPDKDLSADPRTSVRRWGTHVSRPIGLHACNYKYGGALCTLSRVRPPPLDKVQEK